MTKVPPLPRSPGDRFGPSGASHKILPSPFSWSHGVRRRRFARRIPTNWPRCTKCTPGWTRRWNRHRPCAERAANAADSVRTGLCFLRARWNWVCWWRRRVRRRPAAPFRRAGRMLPGTAPTRRVRPARPGRAGRSGAGRTSATPMPGRGERKSMRKRQARFGKSRQGGKAGGGTVRPGSTSQALMALPVRGCFNFLSPGGPEHGRGATRGEGVMKHS